MVSFLLPKRLHQDFYNVYAYCRWADDLGDEMATAPKACACWSGGAASSTTMYAGGSPRIPFSCALRGTVARYAIPARALRRPDRPPSFRTRPSRAIATGKTCSATAAIRPIPWGAWCCICAATRDPGAPGSFRCHLHRAATCQLLAGCHRGSAERPRLSAARRAGPPRVHRRGTLRAPLHAGLPPGDARCRGARAPAVSARAAAGRHGGPPARARPRSLQPRRHARAGQDRRAGLRRACAPPGHLQAGTRGAAAGVAWRGWHFPRAA